MKDPITQATDQHHADEAAYQRRAEALTDEIYADLPGHLDEIVEFTDTEAAFTVMLSGYINKTALLADKVGWITNQANTVILKAVKKIVERRLEP